MGLSSNEDGRESLFHFLSLPDLNASQSPKASLSWWWAPKTQTTISQFTQNWERKSQWSEECGRIPVIFLSSFSSCYLGSTTGAQKVHWLKFWEKQWVSSQKTAKKDPWEQRESGKVQGWESWRKKSISSEYKLLSVLDSLLSYTLRNTDLKNNGEGFGNSIMI